MSKIPRMNTSKPEEHLYHVKYQVEVDPAGVTRDQIPEGTGACNALLLASILFPADGSYSVLFIGKDGRTDEELSDHEMWKVWMMLANRLANSKTLAEPRRQLCQMTFELIADSMKRARSEEKHEREEEPTTKEDFDQ